MAFVKYAYRTGRCKVPDVLRAGAGGILYGLHLIGAERSKARSLLFLKKLSAAETETLACDFCRDVLIPALRPDALKELELLHARGCRAVLISASTGFYLRPLKDVLGLEEILSTELETDTGGRFTGRLKNRNCRGTEKTRRLDEWLEQRGETDTARLAAGYGDSAGDAPMLLRCEQKNAVVPKNKLLRRLKGVENVRVLDWADKKR